MFVVILFKEILRLNELIDFSMKTCYRKLFYDSFENETIFKEMKKYKAIINIQDLYTHI